MSQRPQNQRSDHCFERRCRRDDRDRGWICYGIGFEYRFCGHHFRESGNRRCRIECHWNCQRDGAVDVYALWDITGEVNSWKGTVDANAGWAITGSIYGDKDVYTSTLIDSVSGYVYSAPAA